MSIWLDTLSRELLQSGRFASLIRRWEVTGATSNPTILAKAIAGSSAYDDDIRRARGRTPREILLDLAVDDVAQAADLLAPVHAATHGDDGFVSLECTPDLADDTAATVRQARELWTRLGRPNVMIKVPATDAGVPAIERLTAEGVNVNVTLLFSLARYRQVIDAYLTGLERRLDTGRPIGTVRSVASFFLSRIDARVDRVLPAGSQLRGRVAIGSARSAYALHRERFSGDRWRRLARAGAHIQRPLWASTGTKDRAYSDVLYVEELIADGTVNTMPEATLHAFADHGDPSRRMGEPDDTLVRLAGTGIDLAQITAELERDGVRAFCDSYDELLVGLADRLAMPQTRRPASAPGGTRAA